MLKRGGVRGMFVYKLCYETEIEQLQQITLYEQLFYQ